MVFTPSSGTAASAAIHNRLGQSMETVSHSSSVPKKIPITRMADRVIPTGAGISPNNRISASAASVIPNRCVPLPCANCISPPKHPSVFPTEHSLCGAICFIILYFSRLLQILFQFGRIALKKYRFMSKQ